MELSFFEATARRWAGNREAGGDELAALPPCPHRSPETSDVDNPVGP